MKDFDAGVREVYADQGLIYAVQIALTDRCDLACVHCLVDGSPARSTRDDLTLDELTRVMDELVALGVFSLIFSGGEVAVRPDLAQILHEARKRGFLVKVKTNGALLTPALIATCVSIGVRHVDVSVYSLEAAVHDGITGRRGSLARTLAGVRRARAAGLVVAIKIPVMRPNVESALESAATLRREGFEANVTHVIVENPTRARVLRELNLTKAELRRFLPEFATQAGAKALMRPRFPDTRRVCSAGVFALAVAPNGDLKACSTMLASFGNVRTSRISEIIASEPFRRFTASRRRDVKGCGACVAAPYCFLCPAVFERATGDPLQRPAAWCRVMMERFRVIGGHRSGRDFVFDVAPGAPREER